MSRATIYRSLEELEARGWLLSTNEVPRRYRSSLRIAELGLAVHSRSSARETALVNLHDIARELGTTCMYSVYERGDVVVTDVVFVHRATLMPTSIAVRVPAPVSGAGKALLAHQGSEEIERVVSKGQPAYTLRTKTEPADILAEVEAAFERGYGVAEGEYEGRSQGGGVGAPIFDYTGRVIGAFGVRGRPYTDANFLPSVLEVLLARCRETSIQLGYRLTYGMAAS